MRRQYSQPAAAPQAPWVNDVSQNPCRACRRLPGRCALARRARACQHTCPAPPLAAVCRRRVGMPRTRKNPPRAPMIAARLHVLSISAIRLERVPTCLEDRPTSLEQAPTRLEGRPTSLEQAPTCLEDRPTSLKQAPTCLEEKPTQNSRPAGESRRAIGNRLSKPRQPLA